eukprot:155090_1
MDEDLLPINKRDIKLLVKILQNILNDPNNEQYHNINIKRLLNKFSEPKLCVNLLHKSGFITLNDGTRLVYNKEQLHKLIATHQQLLSLHAEFTYQQNNIQSQYLINSTHLHSIKSYYHPCPCKLDDCLPLSIIGQVLKNYKIYMHQKYEENNSKTCDNIYDSVFCKIGNNYGTVDLLDDHHHVLLHHADQFEGVYNLLCETVNDNDICKLSKCLSLRRNQRDRLKRTRNLYLNEENIVEEQLLDKIHAYYLHTFDIGYKMTENEKRIICDNYICSDHQDDDDDYVIFRTMNVLPLKRNKFKNVKWLQRLNLSNPKFKTETTNDSLPIQEEYQYGYAFHYWKRYQNESGTVDEVQNKFDLFTSQFSTVYNPVRHINSTEQYVQYGISTQFMWYINNKYNTFKEELLCNEICTIPHTNWTQLIQKAGRYLGTDVVTRIKCPRQKSAAFYEMNYGDLMQKKHLIAMMLYCNYDKLQRKLSETYRKVNVHESDEHLKQRHSNYYFWGRFLRECVDCFGMKINRNSQSDKIILSDKMILFHGINQSFTFRSMFANIKAPFSTTTDYLVALNFCANKGMILELALHRIRWYLTAYEGNESLNRMNCFDCQWISDFSNENEIFCIGGVNSFCFTSIIEPSGADYRKYIKALHNITIFVPDELGLSLGFCNTYASKMECQLICRLLLHELYRCKPDHPQAHEFKNCPEYFKTILHLHLTNVKHVLFSNNMILYRIFFTKDMWIKLDILTSIFSNMEGITYVPSRQAASTVIGNSLLIDSVLTFINSHKGTKLKHISIVLNAANEQHIRNYIFPNLHGVFLL